RLRRLGFDPVADSLLERALTSPASDAFADRELISASTFVGEDLSLMSRLREDEKRKNQRPERADPKGKRRNRRYIDESCDRPTYGCDPDHLADHNSDARGGFSAREMPDCV